MPRGMVPPGVPMMPQMPPPNMMGMNPQMRPMMIPQMRPPGMMPNKQ